MAKPRKGGYRIAHFGDLHLGSAYGDFHHALAMVDDAIQKRADHLVFSGDILHDADAGLLKSFVREIRARHLAHAATLTVVPGNHDIYPICWPPTLRSLNRTICRTPQSNFDRFARLPESLFTDYCLPCTKKTKHRLPSDDEAAVSNDATHPVSERTTKATGRSPDEKESTERQLAELQKAHAPRVRELREQLVDELANVFLGERIPLDIVNTATGEIVVPANRKITRPLLRKVAGIYEQIDIDPSPIRNKMREIIGRSEKRFAQLDSEYETQRQPLLKKTPAYKAQAELIQRAESGDAQAQFDLGCLYSTGAALIESDLEKAQSLISKAAAQGHFRALVKLGDDCADYWFEVRNRDWFAGMDAFKDAVQWYCKAAARKDAHAHYRLARLCAEFSEPADAQYSFSRLCSEYLRPVCGYIGEGDSGRLRLVASLYHAAAEQGHFQATKALGDCFAEGIGVDEDKTEAEKWYHKIAEQCRKSAEQGDAEAQMMLGDCYDQGWVVSSDSKKNRETYRSRQAVKWYRKAAEQGVLEAQKRLARCYAQGSGVAKNEVQAATWYSRAGMQGDCDAYEELGDLYAEIGDNRRAARYYRKAGLDRWSDQIRNLGPKRTW